MNPTWAVHLACATAPENAGDRSIRALVSDADGVRLYYLVDQQEASMVWLVNDHAGTLWAFCGCGAFIAPPAVVKWHNRKHAEHLGRRDNTP